jgi:hypothetical protein
MLTNIGSNKYQLFFRNTFAIIFILVLPILILAPKKSIGIELVAIFPIALMFIFLFIVFLQGLFLPIGLSMNSLSKELRLNFFLNKSYLFNLSDIKEYGSTLIRTKSTNYEGILIHLNNGKQFLLSNFNLKDYSQILYQLENSKTPYIGKEKFKFIPYYLRHIKL